MQLGAKGHDVTFNNPVGKDGHTTVKIIKNMLELS